MKKRTIKTFVLFLLVSTLLVSFIDTNAQSDKLTYTELQSEFMDPDYSYWGEVPLWWWEADSLDKERVTWQLEKLSAKRGKSCLPNTAFSSQKLPRVIQQRMVGNDCLCAYRMRKIGNASLDL